MRAQVSMPEFIALVALLISLVAMSIDAMLPALGIMAADLDAGGPNDRQQVLTGLFAGLAVGQLAFGPLADSFGRRPAILGGLGLFIVGSLATALATSFPVAIAGRVLQGFGASGPRVVAVAMVRDRHQGRTMARIMSFAFSVFILVPVLAPLVGQFVLIFATWRAIFWGLAVVAVAAALWFAGRQPETLPRDRRARFSALSIGRAAGEALKTRVTLGYTVAAGCAFGPFVAYLATSQQIFQDQYGQGRLFPVYFGALALAIGAASLVNARLVLRYGMRLLSARALYAALAASAGFLLIVTVMDGHPPLWAFMAYMLVNFFCMGLLFGNYNALAMAPMGHIAGVASAVIGSLTTLISLAIGALIGQAYDGTLMPLILGFALFGLGTLAASEWAERARS